MRLTGGAQPHEGLIEMFLSGQWGKLCIPTNSYNWTLSNASAICQHLGYPEAVAALSREMDEFDIGSKSIWFWSIEDCTGNEANFTRCSRRLISNFYFDPHAYIGVICSGRLYVPIICKCTIFSC